MTPHPLLRSLGLTIAVACSVVAGLAAAPAATAAPQMSVTISDGVKTVKPGIGVTYTTEVENMGADPVDAKVVLTVPTYVQIEGAGDGTVEKSSSTWAITIAPHHTSALQLTAKIGTIPAGEVRVTAVASVYVDGATPAPLIRTADANRIQGVADTPAPRPDTSSPAAQPWPIGWIIAAITTALVLAAAIVVAILLIGRRRGTSKTGQRRQL